MTKQEPLAAHATFSTGIFQGGDRAISFTNILYITLSHSQDINKPCKPLSGFGHTNYIKRRLIARGQISQEEEPDDHLGQKEEMKSPIPHINSIETACDHVK